VDLIAEDFKKTADRDGRPVVSPESGQHHNGVPLSTGSRGEKWRRKQ
jgi:hypothetical protein